MKNPRMPLASGGSTIGMLTGSEGLDFAPAAGDSFNVFCRQFNDGVFHLRVLNFSHWRFSFRLYEASLHKFPIGERQL